ncbi:MAG: hypothetical protein ABFS08_06665 [Pseudomonadota bacterium]
MSSGDLISIIINLVVGLYFVVFYPRSLGKRFAGRPVPRGFTLLQKVVPPVGWMIIALTLIYAVSLLLEGIPEGL